MAPVIYALKIPKSSSSRNRDGVRLDFPVGNKKRCSMLVELDTRFRTSLKTINSQLIPNMTKKKPKTKYEFWSKPSRSISQKQKLQNCLSFLVHLDLKIHYWT